MDSPTIGKKPFEACSTETLQELIAVIPYMRISDLDRYECDGVPFADAMAIDIAIAKRLIQERA